MSEQHLPLSMPHASCSEYTAKPRKTMQTTARLPNIMFSAILFCHGRLAQRLAQVLYTHKAGGSNPSSPTTDTEGLPVGGEAFCHLGTSVPRAGPFISARATTGVAPAPSSNAPRHRGRLVAPSPCRRISSPPRRPAVTSASLPLCRHVSSARFRQSSVFLQNQGVFVQITEQRRKMRAPLLGNCVASR